MEINEPRTLLVSWSVSRGRDTYGYNICRLDDTATGKRYRCNGGGYDMTGTVFADWLQDVAQDELRKIAAKASATYSSDEGYNRNDHPDALYGMTYHYADERGEGRVTLDGACGLSSIERIAKAIGLTVSHIVNRRGNVQGFTVSRMSS